MSPKNKAHTAGPITCALFQSVIQTSETRAYGEHAWRKEKCSIASVAVGDFAKSIFDHFDDKLVLVIGAGEMSEETLRYLKDEGFVTSSLVNRQSRTSSNELAT